MTKPKTGKKTKETLEQFSRDQTKGATVSILEQLFYDFHRHRRQIYVMNFVRGIFFGLGSVIGGTVVVAIIIWLLSLFSGTWLGPLVRSVKEALQQPGLFL